jgi:peroxisomal 3,2-trans-enoyl-CoA isomerase
MSMFQLSIDDRYATILFNAPQRSNALSFEEYFELAALLRQTDAMPSVLVTVLTGTGRFFCAGVNVQTSFPVVEGEPERVVTSRRFAANLDLTDALMSRPVHCEPGIPC